MPEEFIWEMAWRRAIGLALLEIALPVGACYVAMTILFFRKGEVSAGILCTACLLFCPALPVGLGIALAFGWLNAARWQIRAFMALWTGLVALAVLDVTAALVLPNLDGATLRWLFGAGR